MGSASRADRRLVLYYLEPHMLGPVLAGERLTHMAYHDGSEELRRLLATQLMQWPIPDSMDGEATSSTSPTGKGRSSTVQTTDAGAASADRRCVGDDVRAHGSRACPCCCATIPVDAPVSAVHRVGHCSEQVEGSGMRLGDDVPDTVRGLAAGQSVLTSVS